MVITERSKLPTTENPRGVAVFIYLPSAKLTDLRVLGNQGQLSGRHAFCWGRQNRQGPLLLSHQRLAVSSRILDFGRIQEGSLASLINMALCSLTLSLCYTCFSDIPTRATRGEENAEASVFMKLIIWGGPAEPSADPDRTLIPPGCSVFRQVSYPSNRPRFTENLFCPRTCKVLRLKC